MVYILQTYLLLSVIFIILKFITKKFDFIQSKFNGKHQRLIGSESIPLIGGLILYIYILINYSNINYYLIIFSFFILIIGILSDINYISSPNKRLILQCLIILLFLYFFEYKINDLRIDYFDNFFSNEYFKYFFSALCLLILINGSNFIDGSNGLNLGYFFSVFIIIQLLIFKKLINIDNDIIFIILIGISFLLILNLLNYLYLGDSGAYLLAFVTGSILMFIHQKNPNLSPYFIALLLWYPAFENLFSIIRKKLNKINPLYPDNNHLHQLIYKYINKKNFFFKNFSNQATSIIINLYNFFIFLISINFITKTDQVVFFIMLNIFVYLTIYFYLKKKLSKIV